MNTAPRLGRPLRVAALVKQIPVAEELSLGPDGRLVRDGVGLELNAYCRRAVSKGVELARDTGGTCTVVTLGPPSAEDVLREAVAWGADEGIHLCDAAFAGSDTLATARALAAALRLAGPFDLVLTGRNSLDGETGQVGPEVAQLLDLPFAGGVRRLDGAESGSTLLLELELDDGSAEVEVDLPAVLSVAERLCDPCKVDAQGREAVASGSLRRVTAADLGPGPWGAAGSPTRVGATRLLAPERHPVVLDGPLREQVDAAVAILCERGALGRWDRVDFAGRDGPHDRAAERWRPWGRARTRRRGTAVIAVLAEPGRPAVATELLAESARIGRPMGATLEVLCPDGADPPAGADQVVHLRGSDRAEDVAAAVACYVREDEPWAVLAPSTAFGREVAGRGRGRHRFGPRRRRDGTFGARRAARGGQACLLRIAGGGHHLPRGHADGHGPPGGPGDVRAGGGDAPARAPLRVRVRQVAPRALFDCWASVATTSSRRWPGPRRSSASGRASTPTSTSS